MAFRGTTTLTLDEKNRLTVPKKHREKLGDDVVLTCEKSGGVGIWPAEAFDRFVDAKVAQFPDGSTQQDQISTYWSMNSHDASFDSAGRISLPRQFMDHGALGKEITLIGTGNRLIAWEPTRLTTFAEQLADVEPELQQRIDNPL